MRILTTVATIIIGIATATTNNVALATHLRRSAHSNSHVAVAVVATTLSFLEAEPRFPVVDPATTTGTGVDGSGDGRAYDPVEQERLGKISECIKIATEVSKKRLSEQQQKTEATIVKCANTGSKKDKEQTNDCIENAKSEEATYKATNENNLKNSIENCQASSPRRCPPSPKCCVLFSLGGKPCMCEIKERGKVCKHSAKVVKTLHKDG